MDALIRPGELTKRYDGDAAPVVDGVSMQLTPGDTVAVMGPPGSGKPALLNMIAGPGRAPRVCVLVPTRNEAGNVGPLLTRLGPGRRSCSAAPVYRCPAGPSPRPCRRA